MSKVIVITPEGNISTKEFPSGTYREQNKQLSGMIGEACRNVEHVMPVRLYTGLGGYPDYPYNGRCRPNMLVDEEGMYHNLKVNIVGSWLYQTDIHGCPILGNIIIAEETEKGDGLDFIGLSDDQFKLLMPQFERLCKKARENHEIIAYC